jgi:uncharacterized protein YbaR (Trm112 family)
MNLDQELLDLIVCPACHAALSVDEATEELVCSGCGLAYPVRDDIPVLLVDEARATRSPGGDATDSDPV